MIFIRLCSTLHNTLHLIFFKCVETKRSSEIQRVKC